jgi:hypothetical protein
MPSVGQAQIDGLGARFDKGFDEIKNLMRSFDERIRSIEIREASCSPLLVARLSIVEKKLETQEQEITSLREMIELQSKTAERISNAINTITGWGKWATGIATVLISSGLIFFVGRLIYLTVTGNAP